MKKVLLSVGVLALAAHASAQGAPRATASATVGGKKVSVEYGRPSLKGRGVDELLKQLGPDRIWRAGSEQVTTLTLEGDVTLGGKKVPAGTYTLYLHAPESGDYALAVNKDRGQPLVEIWAQAPERLKNEPWPQQNYSKVQAQEVARVPLRKTAPATAADLFTIDLHASKDGAVLSFAWGDRGWSTDVAAAR